MPRATFNTISFAAISVIALVVSATIACVACAKVCSPRAKRGDVGANGPGHRVEAAHDHVARARALVCELLEVVAEGLGCVTGVARAASTRLALRLEGADARAVGSGLRLASLLVGDAPDYLVVRAKVGDQLPPGRALAVKLRDALDGGAVAPGRRRSLARRRIAKLLGAPGQLHHRAGAGALGELRPDVDVRLARAVPPRLRPRRVRG